MHEMGPKWEPIPEPGPDPSNIYSPRIQNHVVGSVVKPDSETTCFHSDPNQFASQRIAHQKHTKEFLFFLFFYNLISGSAFPSTNGDLKIFGSGSAPI